MRYKLIFKFIGLYILIGVVSFIIISNLGSSMIESRLIKSESFSLYEQAKSISENIFSGTNYGSRITYNQLNAIAEAGNEQIWLINDSGEVLIDTAMEHYDGVLFTVDGFDRNSLPKGYYFTGNFFGSFNEDMLSVIMPVSTNMTIGGYLVIHKRMALIYAQREELLQAVYTTSYIIYLLMLVILIFAVFWIIRPLTAITKGAQRLAAGDLNYKIKVRSHDEIGELSETLNYMGGELSRSGEYQKKFIANVSHDFRSPLTSIKGYAEAIRDGVVPPELQDKFLGIIVSESERLAKLSHEMLTLEKVDPMTAMLNPEVFNINKMIKDTSEAFDSACHAKNIVIDLILEGEELLVRADYSRIQQVLYNLIDNAIKFSKKDSVVEIETSGMRNKAHIAVKDHGTGIAAKDLPKIWERFYKTDASRGRDPRGTGLGLSIVKDIIQAHGQKINVVSTEGIGTEFSFTLDLAQEEESEVKD